jgi:hypothetical protein
VLVRGRFCLRLASLPSPFRIASKFHERFKFSEPRLTFFFTATSVPSAPWVLLGGVLGGTLWSRFGKELLVQKDAKTEDLTQTTVSQKLGISEGSGLVAYEALCSSILLAGELPL